MSEQAKIMLNQAKVASDQGQSHHAIDLLRRARLLAGEDVQLTSRILAEMVRIAPAAGLVSEQEMWRKQLARLQPPIVATARIEPVAIKSSVWSRVGPRARWLLPAACILIGVALVLCGGWWFWTYSASRYAPLNSSTIDNSPEDLREPLPDISKHLAETKGRLLEAKQTILAPRPVATAREARLNDHIGLVLWVQQYVIGEEGREIIVEMPVASGSAFAISKDGTMLTNAHVLREVQVPATMGNGVRRGQPVVKVCFGADSKRHYNATIRHVSDRFDIAVLGVDRRFSEPLRISTQLVAKQESVVAYGFPGSVMEIDRAANSDLIMKRIQLADKTGHLSYLDWFPPDAFDSVATGGMISSPNRSLENVLYHLFDARVSGGNSGGPLLRASDDEVVGIVTLAGKDLEHKDNNYALAMPQLQQELKEWLP